MRECVIVAAGHPEAAQMLRDLSEAREALVVRRARQALKTGRIGEGSISEIEAPDGVSEVPHRLRDSG